jgi:hypothetical protein
VRLRIDSEQPKLKINGSYWQRRLREIQRGFGTLNTNYKRVEDGDAVKDAQGQCEQHKDKRVEDGDDVTHSLTVLH